MKERIERVLSNIVHPETGADIVSGGIVSAVAAEGDAVCVRLRFAKRRDPFAMKIKERVEQALAAEFPALRSRVEIEQEDDSAARSAANPEATGGGAESEKDTASENGAESAGGANARTRAQEAMEKMRQHSGAGAIGHIVAVASGKGGVGKSTVTSNLAVALHSMGYSVGVLDADIYGPSQAKMFGAEDYLPETQRIGDTDYIVPAQQQGIKLISIAMFIRPTDALLWRGMMANSALRQLVHQTLWGELDFLLVDLPPGTGDIHLSIISELNIDGAVIVSTPQQVAVADAVRGIEMFRNPNVNIPVLGIIENMAWFTPKELPDNRYYIFGKGGASEYAARAGVETIGEIPLIESVMQGGDDGAPAAATDPEVEKHYRHAAERIVEKLTKKCR